MGAQGVWVAHYEDWSDHAVFSAELGALRWAVGRTTCDVMFWPFGMDRDEAEKAEKARRTKALKGGATS